ATGASLLAALEHREVANLPAGPDYARQADLVEWQAAVPAATLEEDRALVGPQQAHTLDGLRQDRMHACPIWAFQRSTAAEDAAAAFPSDMQRQEQHLHRDRVFTLGMARYAKNRGRRVFAHGGEKRRHGLMIVVAPAAQKVAPLELAAVQGAKPGARQTVAIGGRVHSFQDEGIAKDAADLRGFDLAAFRSGARATQSV